MEKKKWWHKAVFYQIYPRSFADSTNNGIGDLQGIIKRLDYLQELGIDAIWFSPFFPSPQEDYGYDISDYGTINPEYGTMADFDELLEKTHSLGIKIILDMVFNHTSNKHRWFLESRSDRDNPKRNWYIWREGRKKGKKTPNNWKAIIGGSAWEWDKKTQQFYLHQFLPCQPDLNWRNPDVQETMFNYLRFWLDKGVDGFRLDIIHSLFEDSKFRDNPRSWRLLPSVNSTAYLFQNPKYTRFLSESIDMCTRIRKLVDSYTPERMLVGEASGGPQIFQDLYGKNNDGLNLVFNYKFSDQPFSAAKFKETIQETETTLSEPFWPCYFFSNHDRPRMISRFGNNEKKSRLLFLLLLTLRGTPFIYYGEEIGMHQVKIPKSSLRDPIAKLKVMGIPIGKFFGRDGCRTPMQWTSSTRNAGFSSDPNIDPWLPVAKNSPFINVENQKNDERSMLTFFKRLIQFRNTNRALSEGSLEFFPVSNRNCLIFERRVKKERILVLINFNKKRIQIQNPHSSSTKIFSTYALDISLNTGSLITLHPFEGLLLKLH
ncbi:MAG: alpha-glucosidase [Candidatus Heimdallarchaeota archaeon]|nr:MAG: alpha-glucosidase [Candidatus Heimdallarchaeota archaeon]